MTVRMQDTARTETNGLWAQARAETRDVLRREPELARVLIPGLLDQPSLEEAVWRRIAQRLADGDMSADAWCEIFAAEQRGAPLLGHGMQADLEAILERDPAATGALDPILFYKGFHALQAHRLAHSLWQSGRRTTARLLQARVSEVFQVDIHPAVPIGDGVFLDHATGIVVGETAVIEGGVSILQNVTLGGTGKEAGDRHPKIRRGSLIGAGATVLGNVEVGPCSRIGAGSVVLTDVPPGTTAVGVPARIVGPAGAAVPSREMDHRC